MTHKEPKVAHIDAFTVSGLSVRTINSDEFTQANAKLPQLWEQLMSAGRMDSMPNRISNSLVYGVYSDYDTDATGYYTVTAGVMVEPTLPTPAFSRVNVLAGDYLVFEGKGSMPQVVIEVWQRVWRYFAQDTAYKRNFTTDFELYRGADDIAIHIGIMKQRHL